TRPQDAQPRAHPRPVYKSPLGLAVDHTGQRACVALQSAGAVAIVDLAAGKVLGEVAVGQGPCDLVLVEDELFVACEQSATVVRVNLAGQTVTGRWQVGQAPRAVAHLPEAARVFVACRDAQALQALDLDSGRLQSVALPGWPERLIFHRDSGYPYLLALSERPGEALVSLVSAQGEPRILHTNRLPDVSSARGLTSKQGSTSFVLVVHQKPRTKVPATQVAQGWVFPNAVGSFPPGGVDPQPLAGSRPKLPDDPRHGLADPSDVVLSPDHRHAYIACAGADTVLALRTDRFVEANYGPHQFGGDATHGRDDLTLSRRYVTARLPTQANPRRLALSGDGRTLVVSNHLADSLTVIDTATLSVTRHVALGGPAPDAARRGEVLFNSAKMTFQGQFTCASCHPDGGSDGLNWDLTRDGIGNF